MFEFIQTLNDDSNNNGIMGSQGKAIQIKVQIISRHQTLYFYTLDIYLYVHRCNHGFLIYNVRCRFINKHLHKERALT